MLFNFIIPTFTAFILSLVLALLTIKFCNKHNLYDPENPRKIHKGNIPRFGGVPIMISLLLVEVPFAIVNKGYFGSTWTLLLGGVIVFVSCIIDDIVDLPAKLKFLLQIIAGLCAALSPNYYNVLFAWHLPMVLGRILTFFWVLIMVNAYNLIDGLDWLCGGLSFLSVLTIGVIAIVKDWFIAPYLFILLGSIAGFMFWNKPKAKIFLGDNGSQTLGYILAVIPMFESGDELFNYNKILICLLMASIPTIDVLAAVWRRLREHRPIFSSDRRHLHHKLLNIGFSNKAILTLVYSIQILIGVVVFLSVTLEKGGITYLITTYLLVFIFFATLHYINRAVTLKNTGKLEDIQVEEKKL